MTTAREMIPAIGAHVIVRFESINVECWVRDVKNSWGKPRLLIVPVVGSGEQWVELGRITGAAQTETCADCGDFKQKGQPCLGSECKSEKPRSAAEEIASARRAIQSIL